MIHIIDPRTQKMLRPFTVDASPFNSWTKEEVPAKYLADRQMHAADLIAIRTPKGLYQIVKSRHFKPGRQIRRSTLTRYVALALKTRA